MNAGADMVCILSRIPSEHWQMCCICIGQGFWRPCDWIITCHLHEPSPELVPLFVVLHFWGSLCFPLTMQNIEIYIYIYVYLPAEALLVLPDSPTRQEHIRFTAIFDLAPCGDLLFKARLCLRFVVSSAVQWHAFFFQLFFGGCPTCCRVTEQLSFLGSEIPSTHIRHGRPDPEKRSND